MKNKSTELEKYLRTHQDERPMDTGRKFGVSAGHVRTIRRKLSLPTFKPGPGTPKPKPRNVTDEELADIARKELLEQRDLREDKRTIRHLIQENHRLASEIDTMRHARSTRDKLSIPVTSSGDNEATAVVLASDWHIEEPVSFEAVNGLNEFNLDIAKRRVQTFWSSTAKLVRSKQKSMRVDTLVVGLLGDFFSGYIHDELMVSNAVGPCPAMVKAYAWIRDGLQSLLDQKLVKRIVCVCHSGNHARISKKILVSEENAVSLEFAMYHLLAQEFEGKIEFVIPDGYHSYLDVAGFTIRFHHGHAIRFAGGVGGIFVPALKAVNQWNKARRADLDCFGHLHQWRFGGAFMCNGSLIGYGPFSVWVKGDYEVPSQTFFLVSHKRKQVTDICPVWLD